MAVPGRAGYRPELDGLRALAVLIVIVHHVWQPARFSGFVGVHIFFVLSGYLITTVLLRELSRSGRVSFRLFYARRLLRLYPALLLVLVASTAGYRWLAGSLPHLVKEAMIAGSYTGNVYMQYGHAWLGPFGHTWSLAMEEQYYLVWPVVLVVGLRFVRRPVHLAAALSVVAAASALLYVRSFDFTGTDFAPQATAFGLLAGSALALLLSRPSPGLTGRVLASPAAALAGVGLLVGVLVGFSVTRMIPDGWYAVLACVATVLVIGFCTVRPASTSLHRALSWGPAVGIGRISYGVYLWHYPIVLSLHHFLPGWSPWAVLMLTLLPTLAAAALSYRFVETPFLRLKDRLHPDRGTAVMPAPRPRSVPAPLPAEAG